MFAQLVVILGQCSMNDERYKILWTETITFIYLFIFLPIALGRVLKKMAKDDTGGSGGQSKYVRGQWQWQHFKKAGVQCMFRVGF